MPQATREQQRRERIREYEAKLAAARLPVEVMVLFVKGREARGDGQPLEEAFADTTVDDGASLPAAVWVALRQGDVDATVDELVRAARHEFVIGAHQQLDDNYRLTTVEERRGLPDIEALQAQLAAFLRVPRDVMGIICEWGPDEPRTQTEIDTLLDQRLGPPLSSPAPATPDGEARAPRTALRMTSTEFAALLNLTDDQRAALRTLVRQTGIVISDTSG